MINLGALIVGDFYFTGLAMGAFLVSLLSLFVGRPAWESVAKIGAAAAMGCVALAPPFLLLDLSQIFRFWHLFVYPYHRSVVSWGTVFLNGFFLFGAVYAWFVIRSDQRAARVAGVIALPFALGVHGYTGFILTNARARPLWNVPLNPILHLVLGIVSGLALVILIRNLYVRYFPPRAASDRQGAGPEPHQGLTTLLILFLLLELFLLGGELGKLANSTPEGMAAFRLLTTGDLAPWFVNLAVLAGAVVPLLLLVIPRSGKSTLGTTVASLGILVGALAIRIAMVFGGQMVPIH
jgi:molybdopterin-containing oxidoreductase family membrane subunit